MSTSETQAQLEQQEFVQSSTPIEPEVSVEQGIGQGLNQASVKQVRIEEFRITGDTLVAKVKELLHQGNIRRITIKNGEGHTLIEIPLTIGVVGSVLGATVFPVIAAVAVIGAMVTHLTITIERQEESEP